MTTIDAVCQVLARIAPLRLAESWDNVGLLIGSRDAEIRSVMTCLTISPHIVDEAIESGVGLVVVHHPLPFKPLSRITADSITGQMLLRLIGNKIAVYSAHTAFDSAAEGINQQWAEALDLQGIEPLVPMDLAPSEGDVVSRAPSANVGKRIEGAGRLGRLSAPLRLDQLGKQAASAVGASAPRLAGPADVQIQKVAIACGSGGSFLAAARRRGCDALITGEATFHTCLEAESSSLGLVLLGHYWSERFAMERLATSLAKEFAELDFWASRSERDPIQPL